MKVRSPELAEKCQQKFERLIGPLRTRAAACGYALAVHGSLARDIDLIAVPWIENAMSVEQFVAAIIDEIEKVNGCAWARHTDESGHHEITNDKPYKRPHGRLAWEIHLGGGPYVDLSVMPRVGTPAKSASDAVGWMDSEGPVTVAPGRPKAADEGQTMTTYRITTNGTDFRVEMQQSGDAYHSWVPCEEFHALSEAREYRDKYAGPPDKWVPVDGEEAIAA